MNETETFQHYQVLRRADGSLWELGRGAMGVTFKAFDVNLRCEVALKVISSQHLDSEMARARFLREARAAAGLRHRNVASVYHLGNDAESFFYSMEFVDGQTVESLVDARGPLPCVEALQIALQTARALGAAAKQGLVHRDIKPANLMVVHEDEDEEEGFVVKVIDFGLARPMLDAGQSGHITMGGFVGTPQYASPEQIEERDLDTRSDIYSLGVTLWYMLVGQPPFTGSVFQISSQHLTKDPPWDRMGESIPEPVRALLDHLLQKEPANRPQTPARLRAEIEECLRRLAVDPVRAPAGEPSVEAAPDGASSLSGAVAGSTGSVGSPESAAAHVTVVQGPAPKAGTIFAGRYQLADLVAEGRGGQVYRAYDGREDGSMVAVKVLRTGLGLSPQEFYHLQGDLARLRDAAHPNLIRTFVLERIHGYKYCVMEWVCGFTLRDLLRSQGALALRDALNLLGQASDAAAHCSVHRLHRLELAPHQAMLHFPALVTEGPPPSFVAILGQELSRWPAFQLKLDALAPTREASSPPAGAAPRLAGRDTLTSIRGLVEGSYFHALGLLCHELLGGSLPRADGTETITPLPVLSEEGNAVLRRALSTNPGFGNENEFFGALLAACDLRREDVGLPRAWVEAPPAVVVPPSTVTRLPPAPPTPAPETVVAPVTAPPPPASVVHAKISAPVAPPAAATPPPIVEPVEAAPVVVRPALAPPIVETPVAAREDPPSILEDKPLEAVFADPDPAPSAPAEPPVTPRPLPDAVREAGPKKSPLAALSVAAVVLIVGGGAAWALRKAPHPGPVVSPSVPSARAVATAGKTLVADPVPPARASPVEAALSLVPATPVPVPPAVVENIAPPAPPPPVAVSTSADTPPVATASTPLPTASSVAVPTATPRPPVREVKPFPSPAVVRNATPPLKSAPKSTPKPILTPKPVPRAVKPTPPPPRNDDDPPPGFMR